MNGLDLRTILAASILSHGLCLLVVASLWRRHHRQSPALGWWLANYVMQFLAMALLALRGVIPDVLSILPSIPLLLAGTVLLYIGLERYLGQPPSSPFPWVLTAVCAVVHGYYTLVVPSLTARSLNASLGVFALCSQCAWLLLRRVDARLRPATRMAGVVFLLYALISLGRVATTLAAPPGNDFLRSGPYEAAIILLYQMLFIALTFSLFLMVNHRLFADLENDVAQRKHAEAALAESEARFRALAEEALVGVYVFQEGRLRYINPAGAALIGRTPEELLAAPSAVDTFVAEEERASLAEAIHRQLKEQTRGLRHELTVLHKDGSKRIIEALGNVALYEGRPAILGTAQDITDRRDQERRLQRAHQETARLLEETRKSREALLCLVEDHRVASAALQESETLYRSTVSAMIEGVMVFDSTGRVLLGNASAERILGLTLKQMREERSQLSDWQVVREDLTPLPPEELPVARALATGQSQRNVVFGYYRPEGNLVWLLVNAEPILDVVTGRPVSAVVSFLDITTRVQAERNRRAQFEELQRWHEATLGREMRVIELKREVNRLLDELGRPPRYRSAVLAGTPPTPQD